MNDSYRKLKYQIEKLSNSKLKSLYELSIDSKPLVRALLGSMLEDKYTEISINIKKTLNNLTTSKVGLNVATVPNRDKWKII